MIANSLEQMGIHTASDAHASWIFDTASERHCLGIDIFYQKPEDHYSDKFSSQ